MIVMKAFETVAFAGDTKSVCIHDITCIMQHIIIVHGHLFNYLVAIITRCPSVSGDQAMCIKHYR